MVRAGFLFFSQVEAAALPRGQSSSSQSPLTSASTFQRKLRSLIFAQVPPCRAVGFDTRLRAQPCSSSSHRDRSAGSRREPLKKHFPPSAPSANGGLTRWLDCPMVDTSCFLELPFGKGDETWELSSCQSLKHQVHAVSTRAAHHSEVCFVFGSVGVTLFVRGFERR